MSDGPRAVTFDLASKKTDPTIMSLNRNFTLMDGVSLMVGQEMDNALTALG